MKIPSSVKARKRTLHPNGTRKNSRFFLPRTLAGREWPPLLIALLLLFLPFVSSCVHDEEDVFDDSAADRLNKAVVEYARVLESQELGWVLDFYPADRSMGGIAYTAKFDAGDVTMTCEMSMVDVNSKRLPIGSEVHSGYSIVTGRSVILTFDTYNPLLHYWSEPSGNDSDGYASDYEFVFLSASADSVVLRGKKYGNILRMYPLREPQSDYVQKAAYTKSVLNTVPRQRAMVDGQPVQVTMLDNHLNYSDADGTQHRTPFVYTPGGVRFYEPVVIKGISTRELELGDEGQLQTADGRLELPMPTLLERFTGSMTQWHFIYSTTGGRCEMCDDLRVILLEGIAENLLQSWESTADVYIGTNKLPATDDTHRTVIGWSTTLMSFGYEVAYAIDMQVVSEEQSLISITPVEGANLFYNYTYFQPFVDFIGKNSPYVLTFNNNDNPTRVTLTSQANPDNWFTLRLK